MSETREKNAKIWERDPFDWYVEGAEVSAALFRVERFVGDIWDPACGGGNILASAEAAGYVAVGSDVVYREPCSRPVIVGDFLDPLFLINPQNVVCNPPYFGGKGTEAFIRKALRVASGKVAIFVDKRFLAGAKRAAGLFKDHPPTRVWIITPRPSCPPGAWLAAGNKAGGGTADYVWLVWDLTAPASMTQLAWLSTREASAL
jgi:hypothetical protein